jgi:hypothetical protein
MYGVETSQRILNAVERLQLRHRQRGRRCIYAGHGKMPSTLDTAIEIATMTNATMANTGVVRSPKRDDPLIPDRRA